MIVQPIGTVHSPWRAEAPYQPPQTDAGPTWIELDPRFAPGLAGLERFRYAYVLFATDRSQRHELVVHPPWSPDGVEVGVFATRSPHRPSTLGLSVVRILRIDGSRMHIESIDAFDGTSVLDLKPYIAGVDTRDDANTGWVADLPDQEHLRLHVLGLPH